MGRQCVRCLDFLASLKSLSTIWSRSKGLVGFFIHPSSSPYIKIEKKNKKNKDQNFLKKNELGALVTPKEERNFGADSVLKL